MFIFMSDINLSSVPIILDFILNEKPISKNYSIKFDKFNTNFDHKFSPILKNHYKNNNIYNSLRYKKFIENWMLDTILILEQQNILKKFIFELI